MINFLANRRILALLTAFFFVTSVYFFSTNITSTMAFIRQPSHEAETPVASPSAAAASATTAAAVSEKKEASKETPHAEKPSPPAEKPAAKEPVEEAVVVEKPEEKEIVVTLTPADDPMSYGTQRHPEMGGLKLQANLPEEFVPTLENKKRLIVIGDIHGMLAPLETLLQKLEFDKQRDHIISVGDMINKGPDSAGVVSLLMKSGASAVRGNHEDRILLALNEAAKNERDPAPIPSSRKGEADILTTGRSLSPEQVQWLAQLPAILTIEQLRIHVVHAGMVPGVEAEKQEPWAIMNMRTLVYPKEELRKKERSISGGGRRRSKRDDDDDDDLDLEDIWADRYPAVPVETRQGEKWTKAWNRYQRLFEKDSRWTVIYGHDAKRGFREERYSFGLDSGCVKGGALTALVIEGGAAEGEWTQMVLQARCRQDGEVKDDEDDE